MVSGPRSDYTFWEQLKIQFARPWPGTERGFDLWLLSIILGLRGAGYVVGLQSSSTDSALRLLTEGLVLGDLHLHLSLRAVGAIVVAICGIAAFCSYCHWGRDKWGYQILAAYTWGWAAIYAVGAPLGGSVGAAFQGVLTYSLIGFFLYRSGTRDQPLSHQQILDLLGPHAYELKPAKDQATKRDAADEERYLAFGAAALGLLAVDPSTVNAGIAGVVAIAVAWLGKDRLKQGMNRAQVRRKEQQAVVSAAVERRDNFQSVVDKFELLANRADARAEKAEGAADRAEAALRAAATDIDELRRELGDTLHQAGLCEERVQAAEERAAGAEARADQYRRDLNHQVAYTNMIVDSVNRGEPIPERPARIIALD